MFVNIEKSKFINFKDIIPAKVSIKIIKNVFFALPLLNLILLFTKNILYIKVTKRENSKVSRADLDPQKINPVKKATFIQKFLERKNPITKLMPKFALSHERPVVRNPECQVSHEWLVCICKKSPKNS